MKGKQEDKYVLITFFEFPFYKVFFTNIEINLRL